MIPNHDWAVSRNVRASTTAKTCDKAIDVPKGSERMIREFFDKIAIFNENMTQNKINSQLKIEGVDTFVIPFDIEHARSVCYLNWLRDYDVIKSLNLLSYVDKENVKVVKGKNKPNKPTVSKSKSKSKENIKSNESKIIQITIEEAAKTSFPSFSFKISEYCLLKFSTNLSAKLGTLTASTISMKTSESPLFHKDHFQDFNRATKVYANLFFLTRKIFALDSATSNRGKGVALNHKAVRTYIERLKEEADEPTTPCSTGAETDTEEDLFVVGEFDEDLSSTNTADEPSTETDSPKRASPHPAGPNQHFSKFLVFFY